MENTNNMKLERVRRSYAEYAGHEPDADIMPALVLITNYVDTRISAGATPGEAWGEVVKCMENIVARAAAEPAAASSVTGS